MNSTNVKKKINAAPSKTFSHELLVIAPSVADYQYLLDGLRPGIAHLIIDPAQDPIPQITEHLHQLGTITTLHIVSHGAPGCLELGKSKLNLANIPHYQEQLRQWHHIEHLYLWGCNVGAGDAGQEFLSKLHQLTQAQISASSTPIGHPSLGGNWELDVTLIPPTPLSKGDRELDVTLIPPTVGCVSRGDQLSEQPTNSKLRRNAPPLQEAVDGALRLSPNTPYGSHSPLSKGDRELDVTLIPPTHLNKGDRELDVTLIPPTVGCVSRGDKLSEQSTNSKLRGNAPPLQDAVDGALRLSPNTTALTPPLVGRGGSPFNPDTLATYTGILGGTTVGEWEPLTRINTLTVVDNFAYLLGNNLEIVDITDPSNPTTVGSLDTDGSAYTDVEVEGDIAYLASAYLGGDNVIQIIDVSDKENPTSLGSFNSDWSYFDSTFDVEIEGDIAYLANGYGGLEILDISDKENPTSFSRFDTDGFVNDVEIEGDIAYVTKGEQGLEIIDISDKENPTSLGTLDFGAGPYDGPYANNVVVEGDIAYVTIDNSLEIIDVSNRENPVSLGALDTNGVPDGVALEGQILYVPNYDDVEIFDVTNPQNPTPLGAFDFNRLPQTVTVSEDIAYVTFNEGDLEIIGVSDKENPTSLGSIKPAQAILDVQDVKIQENIAYLANGEGGLQILDVSDKENPTSLGTFDTDGSANDVEVEGDIAYITKGDQGLEIIDISDKENPTSLGTFDPDGYGSANDVEVEGDIAYITKGSQGLEIIDVSDKENPTSLGTLDFGGDSYYGTSANNVVVEGDIAYVTTNYTLEIVDVSDKENPTSLGTLDFGGGYGTSANNVVVEGDIAYVTTYNTLEIVDVSDKTKPTSLSSIYTNWGNNNVVVEGDIAYVSAYDTLEIIDVSDKTKPTLLDSIDTIGGTLSLAIEDEYAYLASGSEGLQILGDISNFDDLLTGTDQADALYGYGGKDTLNGYAGDDTQDGGKDADLMQGGAGNDLYIVDNAGDKVVELQGEGIDIVESSVNHALQANVENLTLTGTSNLKGKGNALNNEITGNTGNNQLKGGDGVDRLIGDAGNDKLIGGAGIDILTGGDGKDSFQFNSPSEAVDILTDFNAAQDTIKLKASGFGEGLTKGVLEETQFVLGKKALDADDRIIYNPNTGDIFFDADGTGSIGKIQIATLVNTPELLTNKDFVVF